MPQMNVAWDGHATGAPTNIMRAFVIVSPLVFPLCPVGAWGHLESVPASMNPTAWGGGPDLRLIITTKPKEEDLLVLKEESLTPDVLAKARELVTLIANAKHGPFADDDAATRNTPHFIGVREDFSSAIVACDDIYYIEAMSRRIFAYLAEGVPLQLKGVTIASLEGLLEGHGFRRVSRVMIANVNHLAGFRPLSNYRLLAEMDNGESLVVSRKYVMSLKHYLQEQETMALN